MLKRLQDLMAKRDEGFTLIELLVVVIIIGILAAIAIPVFLNQRNGARDASVKSDINATAKNLESAYTDNNTYPTTTAQLQAFDPKTSPGNSIFVTFKDNTYGTPTDVATAATGTVTLANMAAGTASAVAYQICGFNADSGKSYIYDSANGGLAESVANTAANNCATDYFVDGKGWDNANALSVVNNTVGTAAP